MNEAAHRIAKAPLPVAYKEARDALARCERLDECKDWADKAKALTSYARQAKDQTLFNHAQRIQLRAVDRLGALLKQFDEQGRRSDLEPSGDAPTKLTQREAADAAGLSKDQQVQAVRVANVPREEFERLVEGDAPPTVTALAERGKKPARSGPSPFRNEWCDWVFPIKTLSELPACGLAVLAEFPVTDARRIGEARQAIANLQLWIELLERRHDGHAQ